MARFANIVNGSAKNGRTMKGFQLTVISFTPFENKTTWPISAI
jgi:hypothetical protein